MVQGSPLQYYQFQNTAPLYPPLYQPTFRHYDYYTMAEISEEMLLPSSPNSSQSDSENSMSSTDMASKTSPQPKIEKKLTHNEIPAKQCRWQNCGIWFESLDDLANHVSKVHAFSGPSGLFYCNWDGCSRNNRGFNARYKMLVHVRTHTNQKPHQCCQCEKSFSRAENLKIHTRSHSGEKPYICPVPGCNKAYSNSSDRFKHTRTHQIEKPYLCKVPGCTKRYTDPSSLRKHVKTFKHTNLEIVNNQQNAQEIAKKPASEQISISITKENILNNHDCSCRHNCCLKNCLTEAAELLKLGSLINLSSNNLENVSWNKFLDPLMQNSTFYKSYKEEQMELEAPLDLTVHRN